MTGNRVRQLREDLGMTPGQFASLIGVHPSTLYRWEAAHEGQLRMDPMQLQLMTLLEREVAKRKSAEARSELGSAIVTALLVGGGMFALFKLLEAVFGDDDRDVEV